jgi:hypothetical protein
VVSVSSLSLDGRGLARLRRVRVRVLNHRVRTIRRSKALVKASFEQMRENRSV